MLHFCFWRTKINIIIGLIVLMAKLTNTDFLWEGISALCQMCFKSNRFFFFLQVSGIGTRRISAEGSVKQLPNAYFLLPQVQSVQLSQTQVILVGRLFWMLINTKLCSLYIYVSYTEYRQTFLPSQKWDFFFLKYLFIYLFIFGCVGSSFLCEGFL